jgi:hypothetical protein
MIKETNPQKQARRQHSNDEVDTSRPSLFNTGPLKKPISKPVKKPKANKKSENAMMMEILKSRSK